MYIWILLATIMVALSFFNLSPRPDKDRSVNEIKAATIVNRFRAEHVAASRYMECEIVKQTNNSNWDWDPATATRASATAPVPITITYTNDNTNEGSSAITSPVLAYTKVDCYLPQGYEYSASMNVKHLIYCVDDKAEADGQRQYVACDKTRNRYLVSYAQIPERWLSKEKIEGGKYRNPTPLFMTFLSKATSAGSTYGWTDCFDGTCVLRGYSSRSGKYSRDEDMNQIYEYTLLSDKSIFLNGTSQVFEHCKSNPCLFAYSHLPVADVANHCYRLMKKENNQCGDGPAYTEPDDNGTNENENENETETETSTEDTGSGGGEGGGN